jgi:hypothetical protein
MLTQFWLGSLKGRDHSENLGVHWRIILKWILENTVAGAIGFIWLRLGTGGGILCAR